MSLDPSRTLNLPNSGPVLKIVEEPFSEIITENKWSTAQKRGGRRSSKTARERDECSMSMFVTDVQLLSGA